MRGARDARTLARDLAAAEPPGFRRKCGERCADRRGRERESESLCAKMRTLPPHIQDRSDKGGSNPEDLHDVRRLCRVCDGSTEGVCVVQDNAIQQRPFMLKLLAEFQKKSSLDVDKAEGAQRVGRCATSART